MKAIPAFRDPGRRAQRPSAPRTAPLGSRRRSRRRAPAAPAATGGGAAATLAGGAPRSNAPSPPAWRGVRPPRRPAHVRPAATSRSPGRTPWSPYRRLALPSEPRTSPSTARGGRAPHVAAPPAAPPRRRPWTSARGRTSRAPDRPPRGIPCSRLPHRPWFRKGPRGCVTPWGPSSPRNHTSSMRFRLELERQSGLELVRGVVFIRIRGALAVHVQPADVQLGALKHRVGERELGHEVSVAVTL